MSSSGCPLMKPGIAAGATLGGLTGLVLLGEIFGMISGLVWPAEKTETKTINTRWFSRISKALSRRLGLGDKSGGHSAADVRKILARTHDVTVVERGADGQVMDERLWMQLLVLEDKTGEIVGCFRDPTFSRSRSLEGSAFHQLTTALQVNRIPHVIYESVQRPMEFGLLVWSEGTDMFIKKLRPVLHQFLSSTLQVKHSFIGRTYSNGHEQDLKHALLKKPVNVATHPEWGKYAIFYPLRRSGSFYAETPAKQCEMLLEHAVIGRSFAEQDHAHDIRLSCAGLDEQDNDFLIGILGKALHPLAKVVADMRKTKHTSQHMDSLGPFFSGQRKVQWTPESDGSEAAGIGRSSEKEPQKIRRRASVVGDGGETSASNEKSVGKCPVMH